MRIGGMNIEYLIGFTSGRWLEGSFRAESSDG
jgi:hypothetical protein